MATSTTHRRPRRVAAIVAAAVVVAGATTALLGLLLASDRLTGTASPGAHTDGYTVWDRNDDGTPVRWDPCRPIVVVHHLADLGPVDLTDDLERAVARLRDATGLDLIVAGAVDERPHGTRPPFQPDRYGDRWAPILVAWADPHHAGLPLRDVDRGVGIPVAVGPDGNQTYVTGQVVLNRERDDLEPGFADRATSWGATLLHELAHVLGLGHVDDPDQLMHVHPGTGAVAFGSGDREGLAAIGADAGCRDVPDPQPVEVITPNP